MLSRKILFAYTSTDKKGGAKATPPKKISLA